MSILDKFKKKKPEEDIKAYGWDAITEAFEKHYPGQNNPKHYGVLIPWSLGGNDPLRGISIYETDEYYHFITFGLSELYEKESEVAEISGYGMEFTMKLKKSSINKEDEDKELRCVCGNFQNIARLTFEHGELFRAYEYIYTGQTMGIDYHQTSKLTGFITIEDASVATIDTPNGRVEFVEFIGCTDAELVALQKKEYTVKQLYEKIGSDVTDYKRGSVV